MTIPWKNERVRLSLRLMPDIQQTSRSASDLKDGLSSTAHTGKAGHGLEDLRWLLRICDDYLQCATVPVALAFALCL